MQAILPEGFPVSQFIILIINIILNRRAKTGYKNAPIDSTHSIKYTFMNKTVKMFLKHLLVRMVVIL